MKHSIKQTRVVVIGAGAVGSTTAYTLMIQGICSEIVLIDTDKQRARGEVLDIAHGASFVHPVKVWAGSYKDCADADMIIITAGVGQRPGQTRRELAVQNAHIIKNSIGEIVSYTRDAVILVVTNPVDVMTYVAVKAANVRPGQVFGSGTVLDSARFRSYCAHHFKVSPRNMHAYIIGEHGDSEVAYLSHVNISGESAVHFEGNHVEALSRAYRLARDAAYEIIKKKGATQYAIALATSEITRAVLHNERAILPVSSFFSGKYGVKDVCISFPSIVGKSGVERVLDLSLEPEERAAFRVSAAAIKKNFKACEKG